MIDLSLHQLLELSLAVLYLGLVAVFARRAGRIALAFPWLLLLMAFFVLRAAERLFIVAGIPMGAMSMLVHGASVLALLMLVVGSTRLIGALHESQERAEHSSREYERALQHYGDLMRHRIANPLTAIQGGITTLQQLDLDPVTRAQVLEAVAEQGRRLEGMALHPEQVSEEEHELDAVPRFRQQAG